MPFAGFDSFDDCVRTMTDEEGHDQESAENICGALQAESKADHGNVEELRAALAEGAGLIADVGVDLVSGVDVPAVDSKWVMTKSDDCDGHDYRATSPILLSKADDDPDQRISYAAAMIPREPDKEGDVVATPTVEQAAHDFLKSDGGVDTDHSLIDGEGEVVESWVLKQEREFDLPGGERETYGAGTWMVGIEWGSEAWQRIQDGDLTGLSIYGMAEHVPLERAATCAECGDPVRRSADGSGDTHKGGGAESDAMAPDNSSDGGDGAPDGGTSDDGGGDGPSVGELQASVAEVSESVESVTETLAEVKEAVETEKQDDQEAAAMLAEDRGMEPGDILDILSVAEGKNPGDILDAIDEIEASADGEAKESDGEMGDEQDEEEKGTDAVDKRADEANLGKGGDARGTAAKGINSDEGGGGSLSYEALAEQEADS